MENEGANHFDRWLNTSRLPASVLLPEYESSHGNILKKSFLIRATKAWNELPSEVRSASPAAFKVQLRRHLLARQAEESEVDAIPAAEILPHLRGPLTKMAITREQKVERCFRRWQNDRNGEG